MTRVAVIGAGHVGSTLGQRLLLRGYSVKYGSRNPTKSLALQHTLQVQPEAEGATVQDAVRWGEVIILATPCMHEDAKLVALAHSLGPHVCKAPGPYELAAAAVTHSGKLVVAVGKVLVDVTNPFSSDLSVRWKEGTSAAEVLQQTLPGTYVYKAFNTIGVEHMAHPNGELIAGKRLSMMFAGPAEYHGKCAEIVEAVGFIPEWVGPIRYARNLEAVAELYVHLGSGIGGVKWGRNFNFQVLRSTH